ncbi:MAG: hypothetical protein APR62_01045 [Smithella sp. SDB]|nr:MAG: hypothetical protein APR62_01045 [Smithella sp. SDB]
MNNFKIYIFPRFSRNAQQTGIIMSLLIHLVIIIIFASMPLVKIVPHLQTIHITFQNEDFLSASKTAPAAAALQEKRETTLKKNTPVIQKQPEENNYRQEVIPLENNKIITARETLPNDDISSRKSINEETSGQTNVVNNASHTAKVSLNTGSGSRINDQKDIVESRFGDKGSPYFIYQAIPAYPVLARRLGKEGRVMLKLLIDRNGKLQNIEVVEAAGFGFTEAAIEAVKKSTYAPGYRDGKRIATKALLPVRFQLQ